MFLTHLSMEIRQLLRTPWLLASILFSIITMYMLLYFGMPVNLSQDMVMPPLLLGTAVITMIHITESAFASDNDEGRIPHMLTAPLALEWFVFAKWVAYMLCAGLPLSVLFAFMIEPSYFSDKFLNAIMIFASTIAAITACGLLCGSIRIQFQGNELMGYLLSIPFLFSLVIFASSALRDSGSSVMDYLMIASALITPLASWLSSKILGISY